MPKIKEITDRLMKDTTEHTAIRYLIAKRTVAFFMMLFFVSLLFSIGGYTVGPISLEFMSALHYHIMTVTIIVVAWFLYESGIAIRDIYFPRAIWIPFFFIALALIVLILGLAGHFSSLFISA